MVAESTFAECRSGVFKDTGPGRSVLQADEKGNADGHRQEAVFLLKSNRPTSAEKKPWMLACFVLLSLVAFAVLEAQLTAVGFKLPDQDAVINETGGGHIGSRQAARFEAPHFYSLCRFMARSLAFPILFLGIWIYSVITGRPFHAGKFYRHSSRITGIDSKKTTLPGALKAYALPTLFSIGFSVGLTVSFVYIPPSVSSGCFSSVVAISYILSIVFLKQPLLIIKTIFVFCSFAGVGLVAYETTQGTLEKDAYIGIIVILLAAASLALHQLTYTKSFHVGDPSQSAFRVSVMFAISALLYWPVPLITKILGAEVWHWSDIPWTYLLGGISSALASGFLYAYGLALSNPFFMSLGELLILTVSGLVDHFARGIHLGPYQLSGFAVIGVAFLVLILPDRVLTIDYLKNHLLCCPSERSCMHSTVSEQSANKTRAIYRGK